MLGRLKVTVAQAKLSKNYGFTRMDPYCRIRIGHSVYETPTDLNGSKNPRWNKVFSCNIPRGINSLYIEIFNERYLALDDRVAWAYFQFPSDMFNGETMEEWVALSGKQGEGQEGNVNIILSFTPAPPAVSYQMGAYGNQPVSMAPPGMPGAQMFYGGGYPPTLSQQHQIQQQQQQQQQQQLAGMQQATQRPQIKDEDVSRLQEMFPTLDTDVVRSVLEAHHGVADSAVTALLQMTET
jgi:toll-interacting protein